MNLELRKKMEDNLRRFYLMSFLDGLWFPLSICVLFFLDNGITLYQMGIILGVPTLVQCILEMPSSVWADKYSRRNVLIVTGISYLLCNITLSLSSSFVMFFLAFIFNSIGNALYSGTFTAFTYDTLLSLEREDEYEKVQSRIARFYFLGRVFAAVIGAYVYLINQRAVFFMAIVVSVFHTILFFISQEPPQEKSISTPWRQVREGLNFLKNTSGLWKIVVVFSLMVATSDIAFSYYQPVFEINDLTSYLGVIYLIVNLIGFFGAGLYMKIKSRVSWRFFLSFFLLADLFASLLLGINSIPLVLLAVIILSISFSSQNIFMSNMINRCVPSTHRATSLSIQNLLYMLFYAIFINIVSFAADWRSIPFGMLINAVLALVTLIYSIYVIILKKYVINDNL